MEKDFWLAFDLLRSHKDHEEFTLVRDWVRQVRWANVGRSERCIWILDGIDCNIC